MTVRSYVDSVMHIYWVRIFNFSIQFIWPNLTYIILKFYHTILLCDRDIGQKNVLSQIGPYLEFSICMQHCNWAWILSSDVKSSSSTLEVKVGNFTIVVYYILIHLRMIFLTYWFFNSPFIYRENSITEKSQLVWTVVFSPFYCWEICDLCRC